jgi:hypothetical protein
MKKPWYKVEASLVDCPVVTMTLFGEPIELAFIDWQMWPPSEADGIFSGDLEVTGMAWKYNIDGLFPWQPVHTAAVTTLSLERDLQPLFMDVIDSWIKRRQEEAAI